MNSAIAHRGPDDEGAYVDSGGLVGLGHRRLSILDLSAAGHQPMADPDGRAHVVFNGEIYNYRELRAELTRAGHQFRSDSDTEVLLRLYLEHGEAMLDRLRGMFAFAVWDSRNETLFAARDHFGIKPFYYAPLPGGRLLFSSEVKALLTCPDVPRGLNFPALSDYLAFLWVSDPVTMFEGVLKLPPGHKLRWRDGRLDVEQWWDLDYSGDPVDRPVGELADELAERLDGAVRQQLVSDVPVGAFLSGGLDSSGIVASMARARGGDVHCYTMAFDPGADAAESNVEDLPYARKVAAHLGAKLHEVRAGSADMAALWTKMVWHLDEPIAEPAAINTYLISKRAREDGVEVLLSGQGADELFAGYRWHKAPALMRRLAWLPRPVGRAVAAGSRRLPANRRGRYGGVLRKARKLLGGAGLNDEEQFIRYVQWTRADERAALLRPEIAGPVGQRDPEALSRDLLRHFPNTDPLNARLYRDLKTFLPALNLTYGDKSSMAVGVETRVPFLDVELAEFAATVPASLKLKGLDEKHVLKLAMASRLPREVLTRSKAGFGVPLRGWIRHELREMVGDLLSEATVRRRGLFRWEAIQAARRGVEDGSGDHAYLIWALLTLEIWQQTFLDAPSPLLVPERTAS